MNLQSCFTRAKKFFLIKKQTACEHMAIRWDYEGCGSNQKKNSEETKLQTVRNVISNITWRWWGGELGTSEDKN